MKKKGNLGIWRDSDSESIHMIHDLIEKGKADYQAGNFSDSQKNFQLAFQGLGFILSENFKVNLQ